MRKFITIIAATACVSAFAQVGAKPIPQIVPDDTPQNVPAQMRQFASPQQQFSPAPAGFNPQQVPQIAPAQAPQAQPAAPKPPKFAKLFPDIKGSTGKIGVGFWESYWGWVAVAAVVLLFVVWTIFRKRAKPPLPPIEIALIKINGAKADEKNLSAKAYAAEVSQAVRDYIDAVHNLPAPERTTQEFLELASASQSFDDDARNMLRKILTLSDMAKFAKQSFKSDEKIALADASVEFVQYDDKKIAEKTAAKKSVSETASTAAVSDENGLCCPADDSEKGEGGR